ncbi:hypothetical protein IL306_014670 [Fusarium sp. DS 682]|nr:hypothetical protein IL306_014670 [Fusarium sp. DS 682]
MGKSLPLLKGRISLEEALKEDVDIIQELSYPEKRYQFWLHLYAQRQQIAEAVSRHLNIRQSDFSLGEVKDWIHGSFNACIPIHIAESARVSHLLPPHAIIRFPLPYKVGETSAPEMLMKSCAQKLQHTFGCNRTALIYLYRGFLALAFREDDRHLLDLGYLVLEHIDNGKMLSETWEEHRHDSRRRANLFRHLSRIMLRLAKLPLPRIGSWTMDNRGVLKLANRPLNLVLHQLENAGISTGIPRDRTYTSVEPYLLDFITCQDNRIRYQPNSIHHQSDGEQQLAALTAMRALLPHFTDRKFREGPFICSLTDLHQSNIFVDDDWHIISIIDLEWACARPIEMLGPPDWLSGRSLEELTFHFDEFASLHDEFVDAFEREELAQSHSNVNAEIMRACWKTGTFWYSRALDSSTTLLALFIDHIQPRFAKISSTSWDEFSHMLMRLWDFNSQRFISSKIIEQEQYANQLRKIFT